MYFDYVVAISSWKRAGPSIWTNLNSLKAMILCAKIRWNWPSCSGEFFIFLFYQCIIVISYITPFWKVRGPSYEHILFSITQGCIVPSFDWNWPSGSREEDFSILSIYFRYFVIISPWKRMRPFIWTNLDYLIKFNQPWVNCTRKKMA